MVALFILRYCKYGQNSYFKTEDRKRKLKFGTWKQHAPLTVCYDIWVWMGACTTMKRKGLLNIIWCTNKQYCKGFPRFFFLIHFFSSRFLLTLTLTLLSPTLALRLIVGGWFSCKGRSCRVVRLTVVCKPSSKPLDKTINNAEFRQARAVYDCAK